MGIVARKFFMLRGLGFAVWLIGFQQQVWGSQVTASGGHRQQPTWNQMSASGTLARSAAALEGQLDVYRRQIHWLNDLLHTLQEQAKSKGTTAATALPDDVRQALRQQALATRSRLDPQQLPPLLRAHHVTYLVAWERLGQAQSFGQILPSLRPMVQALQQINLLGQWVMQLYQQQRPTIAELTEPMAVLDGIDFALDEVGRAERQVLELKQKKADLGQQLGGFFRLEQALGNALDLIASADEQGLALGLESPFSIESFQRHLSGLQQHLQQFERHVQRMGRVPVVRPREMTAYLWQGQADSLRTEVLWSAQAYSRQATRLMLQARLLPVRPVGEGSQGTPILVSQPTAHPSLPASEPPSPAHPVQVHGCVPQQVEQAQGETSAPLWVLASEGAFRQQGLWQTSWPESFVVIAESVWGEQSQSGVVPVIELAQEPSPPAVVWAHAKHLQPEDPLFYKDAEAIEVHWRPAPNSLSLQQLQQLGSRSNPLPVVTGYRVLRREGDGWHSLGIVPADVHQWTDRPPAALWGKPLAYAVEAIDRFGGTRRSQAPCGWSAEVQTDPSEFLAWAQVGATQHGVPKSFVHHKQQAFLQEPTGQREVQVLQQRFEQLPTEAQQRFQQQFWQLLSREERLAWLEKTPPWLTDEAKASWLAQPPEQLHGNIGQEMKWSLWMAHHPDHQQQVQSWWKWQTLGQKRAVVGQFWRQADGRRIKAAGWRLPDMAQRVEDVPMAMVLWAYIRAQDGGEMAALERWWLEQGESQQQQKAKWWQGFSLEEKGYLAWPAWHLWQEHEQQAWFKDGYAQWPMALQQQMLAWWSFSLLSSPEQLAVFRSEQSWWQKLLLQLRYGLRPIDKALGFRLGWFVLMSTLLVTMLVWMQKVTLDTSES